MLGYITRSSTRTFLSEVVYFNVQDDIILMMVALRDSKGSVKCKFVANSPHQ